MVLHRLTKILYLFIFFVASSCTQDNQHENTGNISSEKLIDDSSVVQESVNKNKPDSARINFIIQENTNPCGEKRNYDTISNQELKKIYIYLDTIQCILSRRQNYETWGNSWPSEEESINFAAMTDKVDSLLYLVLNNKNSLKINLSDYFNVISSPDQLVRIISYGNANIGGTGRYYKNFIQIIHNKMPVAKLWDEMNYEQVDTINIGIKPIYLFLSRTRWMTWWMLYKINAFEKEESELKSFKTAFFNKSDEIKVDYDYMAVEGDEYVGQKSINYSDSKKEILINHPGVRFNNSDTLSTYLLNIKKNKYKESRDKIGSINITLKFNGKYFEIKQ